VKIAKYQTFHPFIYELNSDEKTAVLMLFDAAMPHATCIAFHTNNRCNHIPIIIYEVDMKYNPKPITYVHFSETMQNCERLANFSASYTYSGMLYDLLP
jgi:hypothetical protein